MLNELMVSQQENRQQLVPRGIKVANNKRAQEARLSCEHSEELEACVQIAWHRGECGCGLNRGVICRKVGDETQKRMVINNNNKNSREICTTEP